MSQPKTSFIALGDALTRLERLSAALLTALYKCVLRTMA